MYNRISASQQHNHNQRTTGSRLLACYCRTTFMFQVSTGSIWQKNKQIDAQSTNSQRRQSPTATQPHPLLSTLSEMRDIFWLQEIRLKASYRIQLISIKTFGSISQSSHPLTSLALIGLCSPVPAKGTFMSRVLVYQLSSGHRS